MFRLGTLARGASRVPNTKTQVWLGNVSTAVGFVRAYVKFLPPSQFISESVCAWMLSRLGLPAPEPLWVLVHRPVLPRLRAWEKDEEKRICFATRALPAQTLFRRSARDPHAMQQLTKWEHTFPAGVFDELVVNDDRGPDNVLTDGRGRYWLIDHNHALGSDRWNPEWLRDNAFPMFANKLLEILAGTPVNQRLKLGNETPACCVKMINVLKELPLSELRTDLRTRRAVDIFLAKRAERLVELTRFRLGLQELPFGGQRQ